jgi:hypothetical protein
MDNSETFISQPASGRTFLKKGVLGAGAAAVGAGLLANASAFGQGQGSPTKGDIATVQPLQPL